MDFKNEILDELRNLSPFLAGIEKTNVFTVPQGYFNTLEETILICVKEDTVSVIDSFSKESSLDVPQGYFDNLSNSILDKIKAQQTTNAADELRALSPMLYSVQNENVFTVPAGYFNGVAGSIINKVKPQPAKVVVMHKRNSIFKYAAAAMIAGVLALGVYKFVDKSSHSSDTITLASLDPSIKNGIKMNEKQFDQTLNTLSDDDIANYLDKNGSEADVAELSSDIDDNSLPTPDQYLLDAKTLDNYLSGDNTKQKDN